jgi:hypothetical protein
MNEMPGRPSPTAVGLPAAVSSPARIGRLGPTSPTLGRTFLAMSLSALWLLCGAGGAASGQDKASILEPRIDAATSLLQPEPRLAGLTDAKRRDMVHFVIGNLLFVLLHEMGHVTISEMGLPVLGREEDAADGFATVSMIWMKNAFSDRVLVAAAKGWFYSDRRNQARRIPVTFYDSHSLDRQRAYQIVCLMVGADPERFGELADQTGLPEDRQTECQADFSNADWSWTKALKDHRRTTQPSTTLPVRYGSAGENLEVFARIMQSVALLEVLAQRFSDKYVWRAPFTIEAKTCGRSHAQWNLANRTVTLCYELAEELATLYLAYDVDVPIR